MSESVNKVSNGCFGKEDTTIFALQVGATFSQKIKERSARLTSYKVRPYGGAKARLADGELWVQVRTVVKTEATQQVFNIEVDEDHTYVTTVSGHNCDAWKGEELRRKHSTFVSSGHFYREHENRRKDQRIGSIKHSAYDPDMGRVELVVHGALKPREGEPLTAEPEYERARAGKNVDVSMSCKIAHDVCTCCGNKAPNPGAYCECFRNYRGKWHPEFQKMAYVLNPDPHFFDISSVANRADRTARFLEYQFADGTGHTSKAARVKAASDGLTMSGADIAAAYGILEPTMPLSSGMRASLGRMKEASAFVRSESFLLKVARELTGDAQLTDREIGVFRSARTPALLRKLAKAKVVLPFQSYACVFGGKTLKEASEDAVLQRALQLAENGPACAEELGTPEMEQAFTMGIAGAENVGTDDVDTLMDGVADRLGMRDGTTESRAEDCSSKLAALALALPGTAEIEARAWAASYAVYKASALRDMEALHGTLPGSYLPAVAVR